MCRDCAKFVRHNSRTMVCRETKKADKKKKTQKSSPELRDLVRVFLGFSPEVRVNFRRLFFLLSAFGAPKFGGGASENVPAHIFRIFPTRLELFSKTRLHRQINLVARYSAILRYYSCYPPL